MRTVQRRSLISRALILCLALLFPARAYGSTIVYYLPPDFPAVCGQNLTTGRQSCEEGATETATPFCETGLNGLDLARGALGLSTCDQESGQASVSGVDYLLLVDDQSLSPRLNELLGDVIRDLGGGPLVFPARTDASASAQAIAVGERLYREGVENRRESDAEWGQRIAGLASAAVASGGSALTPRPGDEPFNVIYALEVRDGRPRVSREGTVSEGPTSEADFEEKETTDRELTPSGDKLHPVLRDMLRTRSSDERIRVLVNLQSDYEIPRFPEPDRGSDALVASSNGVVPVNAARVSDEDRGAAQARAADLIRQIEQQRAPGYDRVITEWTERLGVEAVKTFWLINGLVVDVPLGAIGQMSESEEILFISPEESGEEPPQDANAGNDVDDGRRRINSDPYFNLGQTGGYIGLLDTGVRFSHTLFTSPRQISLRYDCTDGTCDGSPNPSDDNWNHGTSSAGIIVGNNNMGNTRRGVTDITLDSFKIYNNSGLNSAATVAAFQKALAVLDRVIVGEIQASETDTGAIATAADNAYDAGAVVIAANGNFGPGASTVRSPGIAHKAIGVGAIDVQSGNLMNYSGRGAAPDGRIKPDLTAPTNTETASNASDNALQVFSGTSGATPYASAAAALMRNWLRGSNFTVDPGRVYAHLILAGSEKYPFNNNTGAGELKLPTGGKSWGGKVSMRNRQTIEIPITPPSGTHRVFSVALWWPESASQDHNDIDLYLVDPGGTVRGRSLSVPSVFERVQHDGNVQAGTWKVRIRGYRVQTTRQTVYWAARVGN